MPTALLEHLSTVGFMETGLGWVIIGAMAALTLGALGSSCGFAITCTQGIGVLTEKPDLFGKIFLLSLLPGTQALYGLVFAFLTAAVYAGLAAEAGVAAAYSITPVVGLSIMAVGVMVGLVLGISAIYQAKVIAAGMSMTARQEEQFGRAIIIQALIETNAVFALLVGILLVNWLIKNGATINLAAGGA